MAEREMESWGVFWGRGRGSPPRRGGDGLGIMTTVFGGGGGGGLERGSRGRWEKKNVDL